jgi:uncharacterized membrane protein
MDPRYGPYLGHPYVVEHSGGGHHPLGWLLAFLLLALVVALIVWLVLRFVTPRGAGTGAAVAPPADDALDVVRLRYAKGEIDRREFLRITGDLGAPPEPPPAPSA